MSVVFLIIPNAYWGGDYSKTLTQAQQDKHDWIFKSLGLPEDLKGYRILDIGCGWGPVLSAVNQRGGSAVGVTLSQHQYHWCKKAGFDIVLSDYKDLTGSLGQFDAVVSVGALEHFCSIEEHAAGQQNDVYRTFFEICSQH